MGNFPVRYASRLVIYDRRAVIRLATVLVMKYKHLMVNNNRICFTTKPSAQSTKELHGLIFCTPFATKVCLFD